MPRELIRVIYLILGELLLAVILAAAEMIVHRRWRQWVDRLSPYLHPYDRPKRFGVRSWAARSFVLTSPAGEVTERLNAMQKITPGELEGREKGQPSMLSIAGMLGKHAFPTGIEVEWLDGETAELQARQYADWPHNLDDRVNLPLKQRQLVAERAILHLSPRSDGCTRVCYELYVPTWVYLMAAAIVLLVIWAACCLQDNVARLAGPYGMTLWFRLAQTAYTVAIGWLLTRIIPILRLQSISLFDNVIASLGELRQPDAPLA